MGILQAEIVALAVRKCRDSRMQGSYVILVGDESLGHKKRVHHSKHRQTKRTPEATRDTSSCTTAVFRPSKH